MSKSIRAYPRRIKYKAGQRYFHYVILGEAPTVRVRSGRTYTAWRCLCDCGKEFPTTTKQIRKGRKSCGCLTVKGQFKLASTREVIGITRFNHYRNSARQRGLRFELDREKFIDMIFSNCHYCGQEPYLLVTRPNHSARTNGIDRQDNDLGYTPENSVPCCKFCQFAKGTSTLDEFLIWLQRIKRCA